MAERQKTKPKKTARGSLSSPGERGHKTRTPVAFSPSATGSGRKKARAKKSKSQKVRSVAAEDEAFRTISIASVLEHELRDIGELSFPNRERKERIPQPKAPLFGVAANDQRQRISATKIKQTPWRKICDLLITAGDGSLHTGTAWFISPRTLVTAGHCVSVFSPGSPTHGKVRKILVMPARNGETDAAHSPFGWVEVPRENLRVHPNWENGGDIDFDYGAILCPENAPLGAQTGFFDFGHFLDQDLDETSPTISGYPDNVLDGTQWFEINRIKELTATRVFYDIFTSTGQSGSPVFFSNTNGQLACAIHNFGDVQLNSGVRINPQVIAQINAWKV